jgi:hypothetical protein
MKSSFSGANGCVDVTHTDHAVLVRDSKFEKRGEESPIIEFTPTSWRSFLILAAEWDRESEVYTSGVILDRIASEYPVMIVAGAGADLHFSWEEWNAFVDGAKAGEFVPEAIS